MNAIGIALAWCIVQVTLISLLAAGVYLLVRRLRPAAAAPVVLAGLVMVVVLSLLVLSPWPRWTMHSVAGPRPTLGAGQGYPRANARGSSALPCAEEGQAVTAGGNEAAAVKDQPSGAAIVWQALVDELAQPQAAAPAGAWHWPELMAVLLLAAMACGLGWLMLGVAAVRWQRLRSRPVAEPRLLELVDVLCAELACRRPVEVRQADDLATAATIGWRRPVLLLPPDWTTWTAAQQRAVLAHEIVHARSHNFIALLVGQFGLALHFYHPLLHWLMGRLRLEQELAADAAAARISGGQRQYLTTIAEIALRQQDRPLLWPARSFLPTHTTFLRRIAMLRDSKLRFDRLSPATRLITVGLVLMCGLLVAGLRGAGPSAQAMAADESVAGKDRSVAADASAPADQGAATADEKATAGKKEAATGKKDAASAKDQPKPAAYCTLLCCDKLLTDLNVTDEQRTELDKLQERLKGTILGGGVKSLQHGPSMGKARTLARMAEARLAYFGKEAKDLLTAEQDRKLKEFYASGKLRPIEVVAAEVHDRTHPINGTAFGSIRLVPHYDEPAGSDRTSTASSTLGELRGGRTQGSYYRDSTRTAPRGTARQQKGTPASDEDADALLAELKRAGLDMAPLTRALMKIEDRIPKTPNEEMAKALERVVVEYAGTPLRVSACRALENWGTSANLPALRKVAKELNPGAASAAQRAIDNIEHRLGGSASFQGTEEDVDDLLAGLKYPDMDPRFLHAMEELRGRIPKAPNPAVARALEAILLEKARIGARIHAANALRNWGTTDSITALKKAAQSSDSLVVTAANEAIESIQKRAGLSDVTLNVKLSEAVLKCGLSKTIVKPLVASPVGGGIHVTAMPGMTIAHRSRPTTPKGSGFAVYFTAASAFQGKLIAKAMDKEGAEIGRSVVEVEFSADDAKYVSFTFADEMDAHLVQEYLIDIKK